MRRSALISPWGVGAIVPFVNDESLMIAGLDMWRYKSSDTFVIKDERLQKRLGVKELRWPPDFRDYESDSENCNLKIPAVRFPRWNYCPFCGTMQKVGLFTKQPKCDAYQWSHGRKCDPNKHYRKSLIPERFVVVCPNGHIDDFPVAEWIHANSGHTYDESTCRIRRSTGGTSAALTGVRYECSCGASKSIAGALRPGALKSIGYTCKGSKPWLGIEEDTEHPCDCDASKLRVLQRGASNVWFADTRSSIYIPTDDDTLTRRVAEIVNEPRYLKYVLSHRVNGELDSGFISMIAEMENVDLSQLLTAFKNKVNNIEGLPEVSEEMSEDEYRLAEYKMLIKNSGGDALNFHSINYPISKYHSKIRKLFKSVSLVKKLRETRAFIGFSRLEPNTSNSIEDKKSMIRLGNGDWLPAIEVYGEGIFFEFSSDELKKWAEREDVKKRIEPLITAYKKSFLQKVPQGTFVRNMLCYIRLHI